MHQETKTFIGLTVLWCLLYRTGLELNPAKSPRCVGIEHLLCARLCSRHWNTERNYQYRPLFSRSLHWGGGETEDNKLMMRSFQVAVNVT